MLCGRCKRVNPVTNYMKDVTWTRRYGKEFHGMLKHAGEGKAGAAIQ
jgi:hypothetical protein